jgi:hypothetical protein
MILYELLVGKSGFSRDHSALQLMKIRLDHDVIPVVPDFVIPRIRDLINLCLDDDPDVRPPFAEIFDILEEMKFKITHRVNQSRVQQFVEEITQKEKIPQSEIEESTS